MIITLLKIAIRFLFVAIISVQKFQKIGKNILVVSEGS